METLSIQFKLCSVNIINKLPKIKFWKLPKQMLLSLIFSHILGKHCKSHSRPVDLLLYSLAGVCSFAKRPPAHLKLAQLAHAIILVTSALVTVNLKHVFKLRPNYSMGGMDGLTTQLSKIKASRNENNQISSRALLNIIVIGLFC